MPTYVSRPKGDFDPAPAGAHQAVCCDVVDLGRVTTSWQGKERVVEMVQLRWQINEVNPKNDKRYLAVRRYTKSLGEKASLYKDLVSWRGRAFTENELQQFDLDTIIGVNCLVNIVHKEKDGTVYGNVNSVMPLPRGMQKIDVEDAYVMVRDRPPDQNGQQRRPDDEPPGPDWGPDSEPSDDSTIPF